MELNTNTSRRPTCWTCTAKIRPQLYTTSVTGRLLCERCSKRELRMSLPKRVRAQCIQCKTKQSSNWMIQEWPRQDICQRCYTKNLKELEEGPDVFKSRACPWELPIYSEIGVLERLSGGGPMSRAVTGRSTSAAPVVPRTSAPTFEKKVSLNKAK